MTDISGKTAFITGGAAGIGYAVAEAMGKRGANVMIGDLDAGAVEAAVTKLSGRGIEARGVVCDVSKEVDMRAAAEATIDAFGKVHIVVNNAGVGLNGKPGKIDLRDWRWIVDINLMGVVHGVEIFTPLIESHGEGGHFVNVASMAGHVANAGMSPYFATKFAVVGYSEAIRMEFAQSGGDIGVSVLCPAWVNTNIHHSGKARPSGGADNPEQLAAMDMVIRSGLPADAVGEWTADCVADDRFYIFTHPEFASFIDARFKGIKADYDACAGAASLSSSE